MNSFKPVRLKPKGGWNACLVPCRTVWPKSWVKPGQPTLQMQITFCWNSCLSSMPASPGPIHNPAQPLFPGTPPSPLNRSFVGMEERTVHNDNTISFGICRLQIPPHPRRYCFAKAKVRVRQHWDGNLHVLYYD